MVNSVLGSPVDSSDGRPAPGRLPPCLYCSAGFGSDTAQIVAAVESGGKLLVDSIISGGIIKSEAEAGLNGQPARKNNIGMMPPAVRLSLTKAAKGGFAFEVEMSNARRVRKLTGDKARALADKYCGRFTYLPADEQCVYILWSATAGAYKIGITKSLNSRIKGIKIATSLPDLAMLHKIYATDASYLEAFLHMLFGDRRADVPGSTEFFYLTPDDLRWLAGLSNVDSRAMSREQTWYSDEPHPWSEQADLIVRIGDLHELTLDQLRRIVEIAEGQTAA